MLEHGGALRSRRRKLRRGALPPRGLAAERPHQSLVRALDRQAQERGQPGRARRAAGEHAKAFRVALDLVEEQRRRHVLLDVELADRAELEVPVGAADVPQLAELLDLGKPGAQIERIHEWRTKYVIIASDDLG